MMMLRFDYQGRVATKYADFYFGVQSCLILKQA